MNRATQIAAAVIALAVTDAAGIKAAEEAAEGGAPASFVSLKFEGVCDERNNRLWLTNIHTFKTVATTVRWRAAGGKDLTEEFFQGLANLAVLHVSRNYRRKGIASLLVEEVARLARADSAQRVYVSATPSGPTVEFYRSHGFEPTR